MRFFTRQIEYSTPRGNYKRSAQGPLLSSRGGGEQMRGESLAVREKGFDSGVDHNRIRPRRGCPSEVAEPRPAVATHQIQYRNTVSLIVIAPCELNDRELPGRDDS